MLLLLIILSLTLNILQICVMHTLYDYELSHEKTCLQGFQ